MSVEIVADLKALKLNGMASCYPELLAKSRHSPFEPVGFMKQLIDAETAERTVRSMAVAGKRLPGPIRTRPVQRKTDACAAAPGLELRRKHPRIVRDKDIAGAQQTGQVAHRQVGQAVVANRQHTR